MEVFEFDGRFVVLNDTDGERSIPDTALQVGDTFDTCPVIRVVEHGYGVRLSAPGYLDCTEWEVFDTSAERDSRAKELEEEDEE